LTAQKVPQVELKEGEESKQTKEQIAAEKELDEKIKALQAQLEQAPQEEEEKEMSDIEQDEEENRDFVDENISDPFEGEEVEGKTPTQIMEEWWQAVIDRAKGMVNKTSKPAPRGKLSLTEGLFAKGQGGWSSKLTSVYNYLDSFYQGQYTRISEHENGQFKYSVGG